MIEPSNDWQLKLKKKQSLFFILFCTLETFNTEQVHRYTPDEGGLPRIKDGRCSSEILERTPKGYQDPDLWGRLEILNISCQFFFGSPPYKAHKSSHCLPFDA